MFNFNLATALSADSGLELNFTCFSTSKNATVLNHKDLRPECDDGAPLFLSDTYKRGMQARKRQADASQYGRSMIEMLGVLAIIGVLSVGGIAGYSKAMTKFRINKTVDQVSQLAQNIRTLYGSQKNYSSLSSTVIKKAHLAPDEMFETSGSTTMTNPFGGEVWVMAEGKNSGSDTKSFTIAYFGIPQEACIDILTQNWGTGSSSGLIAVGQNISNHAFLGCSGSGESYTCADDGVMDVVKAVSTCNSTTNNYIVWKFY